MAWIIKHKRNWRTAVLILLLISLTGPWAFDLINVPAEYTCSPPNYRLEGDFCGVPLAGLWIFIAIIGNFVSIIAKLITGAITFNSLTRELIFSMLYLFLIVPFFTTLLLILGKDRQFWLQKLFLGLAATIGLIFWGLSNFSVLRLTLWGFWLYVVVAVIALLMEMRTSRIDKKAAREIVLSDR